MLKVRRDGILVKPLEEDSSSGVYIPPLFRQSIAAAQIGEVYACGPYAPTELGDIVIFGKWDGQEVAINGEQLVLIRPRSIFAIK